MAIFSLVDCNNFYVSCERIFNPKLRNKPVVVLSNNDGCVIARSNEAKVLGVSMGEPYFKMRERFGKSVVALSSNFALYGDISRRVMHILAEATPDIEHYSIDESFLRLDGVTDLKKFAATLKQKIYQCLGLPVSIGIGETKVLAKIANHLAKKQNDGIKILTETSVRDNHLKQFAIENVWGIGHKLALRLKKMGINNAWQLQQANIYHYKKMFNVMLARMIYELRGVSCMDLELVEPKQSIISSRSFGQLTSSLNDLEQALTVYTTRACEKLRTQKSLAYQVAVFVGTNRHKTNELQQSACLQTRLPYASNHTTEILQVAQALLKRLYREHYRYQKIGVMLTELILESELSQDLNFVTTARLKNTMPILDKINQRFGQDTLFLASAGVKQAWQARRANLSRRYTTRWDELLQVKC